MKMGRSSFIRHQIKGPNNFIFGALASLRHYTEPLRVIRAVVH